MPLTSRIASLARNLLRRGRVEHDLDDEVAAFLDQLTEEKRRGGMTETEAGRAARIELGGTEQIREEVREVRTGRMLEELLQDLRFAARMLRRNPAFTIVAVLALALGIGANTGMFSVAYGILFRPLPVPQADRVAVVYMHYFPRDFVFGTMCMRDYQMWREDNRAFEQPSLFQSIRMDIGGREAVPEQVQGAAVTSGFFSTLSVRPLLGRTFSPGDDRPGAEALAVIGESIWRRRFAGSPTLLGQPIVVNGVPATVIGIIPSGLHIPRRDTEIWTNLVLNPPTRYGPWFYLGIARLKPGVTIEQAQAEVNNIGKRMMRQNPSYQRVTLPIRTLRDAILGTTVKPALLVLAGAVGLVLLIAAVNVANLMLARATVREREMALRLSLGAGRGRLVRQLLTESVLLAAMGGVAGLGLAWGAVALVRSWNPGNLPLIDSVRLDGGALAFTFLLAACTGILFGLAPALQSVRTDLISTIKEGGRSGSASQARGRTRAVLVVSELAISLTLLVGAGLLLRSFANLQRVTGGFTAPPRQILTMLISPGSRKYRDPAAGLPFYDEVLRRARSVPGAESASITDTLPPDRQGDADTFALDGQTLAPGQINPIVTHADVSPGYFHALGIPFVAGRDFTQHDDGKGEPVAIVSEAFARRFLPNQNPVGKRLGYSGTWMQIVGVVGNVKYMGLTVDSDPAYYIPFAQNYGSRAYLAVRASGDAARLSEPIRRAIQSIDPGVTLAQIGTMEQEMALSVSQPRFDTILLALFAAIALILAAVGIYGLIAYSVAQRTHEIGVRMALGAARSDVVWMVVRQGGSLAAIGIVVGVAGALALTGLLKTMLFGVGATDLPTFAAAPLGLMLVVLVATLIPALRATRISPVAALRYE